MKLSGGATVAARDAACRMRLPFLLPLPAHPFFPSSSSRFRRKAVRFRSGVLRAGAGAPPPHIRRCYPMCSSFTCDVSARQVLKVLQSAATARRWRTCEYPIFTASHSFPFLSSLFDFLRDSVIRSSFNFSPMFVSAWIIQLLVSSSLSRVLALLFCFFCVCFLQDAKYNTLAPYDGLVPAFMIDDLLFRPTTNAIRLSVPICIMLLSQLHLASLFPYFILSVTVSTLSIQVRGEMSFYFRTPLLLGRALAV